MSRTPVIEDYVRDWLEEGPASAPRGFVDAVLVEFPSIPQRRVASRVPWRFPPMNGFARILAAIAVTAIAVGGLVFLNRAPSIDVGGPAVASPAVSVAPSSSSTSRVAGAIDTSSWKTFTSIRHGETLRYPAGWTATPATAPWTAGTYPANPPDPTLDVFVLPSDTVETFTVTSQPLPKGVTGAAWLADWERSGAASSAAYAECWPAPADMERTRVDGQPAWVHGGCGFIEAITFVGGRVYVLVSTADFERPLFDAFLSTITFDPTRAVDTPVVRPGSVGASPSPR